MGGRLMQRFSYASRGVKSTRCARPPADRTSGAQQRFDVVVGADGLHSQTRALAFGPEEPFERYPGFCRNLFSLPNDLGLSHEAASYSESSRQAHESLKLPDYGGQSYR